MYGSRGFEDDEDNKLYYTSRVIFSIASSNRGVVRIGTVSGKGTLSSLKMPIRYNISK